MLQQPRSCFWMGVSRRRQTVNQQDAPLPAIKEELATVSSRSKHTLCGLLFTCLCVQTKGHLTFARRSPSSHLVPASLCSGAAIERGRYRLGGASRPVITCLLPHRFHEPSPSPMSLRSPPYCSPDNNGPAINATLCGGDLSPFLSTSHHPFSCLQPVCSNWFTSF